MTVMLTLGRLPKALDLARGFAAIGRRVIVAEPFRRHLTGASRAVTSSFQVPPPATDPIGYRHAIARIAAEEDVSLVLPVSEETIHVGHLAGHLPPKAQLFTMAPDRLLALHDKLAFIDTAIAFGLCVPESARLGTPAAARIASEGDHVIKPLLSCSGRGVSFRRAGAPLPTTAIGAPALVQRRIEGPVVSSFTLAHGGNAHTTILYRGSIYSGTVAVAFERVDDQPMIHAWIGKIVGELGWTGFISFDFIVDAAGVPWGIECNPRATSGLHFLDSAELARAILDPQAPAPVAPRGITTLQLFYSVLTEAQGAWRDHARLRQILRTLFSTRDASWSSDDPMPFLTMTWTSWEIIAAARRANLPFGKVATMDVGWY
jgi:hypothetical protein